MNLELNTLHNADCLPAMREMSDNAFDLAIVDPPYFSGPEKRLYYGRKVSTIGVRRLYTKSANWEMPTEEYFFELERISKNQIVWGVNYFNEHTFSGSGRIVWDKRNESSGFSDCEIAFTSLHKNTRKFTFMWNGMLQGKSISEGHVAQGNKKLNEVRVHPTQKPVALYKWLLLNYAKPGDKILDTHVGSGSSIIACIEHGYDWMGFEIDPGYHAKAQERISKCLAQGRLAI